jgi:PAS domain S-box-containing protein
MTLSPAQVILESSLAIEKDPLMSVSFRAAIDDVEVYGFIMLDPQGRVVIWNRGATKLLGFSEPEVLGQHFEFIFTPEDRTRNIPRLEIADALRQGYAYDDRWHVRKDKIEIYVHGGLCLLKTDEGQPLGFVKIIRDQTERKAKLVEAHQDLEKYAAMLEDKVAAERKDPYAPGSLFADRRLDQSPELEANSVQTPNGCVGSLEQLERQGVERQPTINK